MSTKSIIDREQTRLEFSVQECLKGMGISLLSEWDIFAFVYRHGPSLTSADQIARLIGYESPVVDAALDRLESAKLIERVGHSQGVRLHRILALTDARHRHSFQQLISLSGSRAGRLQLARLLRPVRSQSADENDRLSLESGGTKL